MAIVEVDFEGAPPAQGGGQDYVPPGKYLAEVQELTAGESKNSGKQMLTLTIRVRAPEEYAGKKLTDYFVIERGGKSLFGLQRFHAFMLALGVTINTTKVRFDTEKIVGRQFIVEVIDEKREATEQYPERTVSRAVAYYTTQGLNPVAKDGASPAPAVQPAAPAPEPAPAATVAAPATVAEEPIAAVAADIDDLFR